MPLTFTGFLGGYEEMVMTSESTASASWVSCPDCASASSGRAASFWDLVISFAGSYREHPVNARINMPAAIHLFIRNLCLSQLSYDSWKFPFPFLIYIKKANACKFSESDINIRSFPL